MNAEGGILAAFAAGLLSFLSPCVLPLVPSYLAMLAGTSVASVRDALPRERALVFGRSIAFALGFTVVFVTLGLVLSRATAMIGGASRTLSVAAGLAVIILGLNVTFDFLKVLNREARFHPASRPAGAVSAFLFGAAFAAGWSPCVGPILASILFLAGTGSAGRAAVLLGLYSFGLALPFLAAGAFFARLERPLGYIKKHLKTVRLASGALLVLIGSSMLAGNFRTLSGSLTRWGYALDGLTGTEALVARGAFTAFYGALACLAAIYGFRAIPVARRAIAFCLAASALTLALMEASGVLISARTVAAWFLFQGI